MKMIASPIVLVLAVIGLGVLIARAGELWKTRTDSSKHARRQRIRFGTLSLSLIGLMAIFAAQVGNLPLWIDDVGIVMIFGSWAAYIVLSMIFGFREGFDEVMDQGRKSEYQGQSRKQRDS
jgi:hypothetical protein